MNKDPLYVRVMKQKIINLFMWFNFKTKKRKTIWEL